MQRKEIKGWYVAQKKKTEWWRDLLAVIIVVSIQDMVWTE